MNLRSFFDFRFLNMQSEETVSPSNIELEENTDKKLQVHKDKKRTVNLIFH